MAHLHCINFIKLDQNADVKRLSLSEIITAGMPKIQTHYSKNNCAMCGASAAPVMGINFTNLLNLSTIEKIPSCPFEFGRCVIKSMLTDSKHALGGGKGCSSPAGFWVETFVY